MQLENATALKRERWLEVGIAVVLSLATLASAWSAYQSSLWGGVQTFRLADRNSISRKAAQYASVALQQRGFDASMFIEYSAAVARDEKRLAQFLYERFRPPARKAVDAWLRTKPLVNPAAPPHPFVMAEYVQAEADTAQRLAEEAEKHMAAAEKANRTSDNYILFTVLFSMVLFFGGMAGTFRSQRLQLMLGGVATILFIATLIALTQMPICRE